MNVKKVSKILIILLSLANGYYAQRLGGTPEVYVESWKVEPKIRERALNLKLNDSSGEQVELISDEGRGEYTLILRHFPAEGQYELEHWTVELREVLSSGKGKKKHLGDDLLRHGGDYFPKEDAVGLLYPKDSATTVLEKLLNPFYPISAKRVIKIKNFYMIIQVNSYRLSESNPKKLESMDVTIEFTNSYKSCGTQ
jgi:hypothetical protein